MPQSNDIKNDFSYGEINKELWDRYDLDTYGKSSSYSDNLDYNIFGGVKTRKGNKNVINFSNYDYQYPDLTVTSSYMDTVNKQNFQNRESSLLRKTLNTSTNLEIFRCQTSALLNQSNLNIEFVFNNTSNLNFITITNLGKNLKSAKRRTSKASGSMSATTYSYSDIVWYNNLQKITFANIDKNLLYNNAASNLTYNSVTGVTVLNKTTWEMKNFLTSLSTGILDSNSSLDWVRDPDYSVLVDGRHIYQATKNQTNSTTINRLATVTRYYDGVDTNLSLVTLTPTGSPNITLTFQSSNNGTDWVDIATYRGIYFLRELNLDNKLLTQDTYFRILLTDDANYIDMQLILKNQMSIMEEILYNSQDTPEDITTLNTNYILEGNTLQINQQDNLELAQVSNVIEVPIYGFLIKASVDGLIEPTYSIEYVPEEITLKTHTNFPDISSLLNVFEVDEYYLDGIFTQNEFDNYKTTLLEKIQNNPSDIISNFFNNIILNKQQITIDNKYNFLQGVKTQINEYDISNVILNEKGTGYRQNDLLTFDGIDTQVIIDSVEEHTKYNVDNVTISQLGSGYRQNDVLTLDGIDTQVIIDSVEETPYWKTKSVELSNEKGTGYRAGDLLNVVDTNIEITIDSVEEETKYKISNVVLGNGGLDYEVGDILTLDDTNQTIEVESIEDTGEILTYSVIEDTTLYDDDVEGEHEVTGGTGTGASFILTTDPEIVYGDILTYHTNDDETEYDTDIAGEKETTGGTGSGAKFDVETDTDIHYGNILTYHFEDSTPYDSNVEGLYNAIGGTGTGAEFEVTTSSYIVYGDILTYHYVDSTLYDHQIAGTHNAIGGTGEGATFNITTTEHIRFEYDVTANEFFLADDWVNKSATQPMAFLDQDQFDNYLYFFTDVVFNEGDYINISGENFRYTDSNWVLSIQNFIPIVTIESTGQNVKDVKVLYGEEDVSSDWQADIIEGRLEAVNTDKTYPEQIITLEFQLENPAITIKDDALLQRTIYLRNSNEKQTLLISPNSPFTITTDKLYPNLIFNLFLDLKEVASYNKKNTRLLKWYYTENDILIGFLTQTNLTLYNLVNNQIITFSNQLDINLPDISKIQYCCFDNYMVICENSMSPLILRYEKSTKGINIEQITNKPRTLYNPNYSAYTTMGINFTASSGLSRAYAASNYFAPTDEGQIIENKAGSKFRITKYYNQKEVEGNWVLNTPDLSTSDTKQTRWNASGGANPTEWRIQRGWVDAFSQSMGYPNACAFMNDSLWLGGTLSKPTSVWKSKSGDYFNFGDTTDQKTDSLALTLSSNDNNIIKSMHNNKGLSVITETTEYLIPKTMDNVDDVGTLGINDYCRPERHGLYSLMITSNNKHIGFLSQGSFFNTQLSNIFTQDCNSTLINPTYIDVKLNDTEGNIIYVVNDDGSLSRGVFMMTQEGRKISFSRYHTFEKIYDIVCIRNTFYAIYSNRLIQLDVDDIYKDGICECEIVNGVINSNTMAVQPFTENTIFCNVEYNGEIFENMEIEYDDANSNYSINLNNPNINGAGIVYFPYNYEYRSLNYIIDQTGNKSAKSRIVRTDLLLNKDLKKINICGKNYSNLKAGTQRISNVNDFSQDNTLTIKGTSGNPLDLSGVVTNIHYGNVMAAGAPPM